MIHKPARSKGIVGAFAAMTAVVALSSAAFACTTFKGTFSLKQGLVTKTNTGNNTGMGFCSGSTVQTMTLATKSAFTVSVASSSGSCASQLPNKTFAIKHIPLGTVQDCMNGVPFNETLSVSSTGSGSRVVAGGQLLIVDDTVCVADSNVATGNGMAIVAV